MEVDTDRWLPHSSSYCDQSSAGAKVTEWPHGSFRRRVLLHRKPVYDFILVINCYRSSISHRFGDIALQTWKSLHSSLRFLFRAFPWNFVARRNLLKVEALSYFRWKLRDPGYICVVTIHLRYRPQTNIQAAYHDNTELPCKLQHSDKNG